ncbi:deoxyribonuclease [Haladaptatus sp. R4]|uniref:TRAM domain-containing protein n=1 Tax=Haladaptatus sp. R4 TaxID=1679489 RepID=UPI0007B4E6C5|nr:TRAM domain-containing protein [Haladaptatus sp. R4]KZN24973.1 deoxyribonuclease [Haladaptatus sp. R4]
MEIPDELLCVFSAQIEERNGAYHLTLPERELDNGVLDDDETYRVALLGSGSEPTKTPTATTNPQESTPEPTESQQHTSPPVEVGDRRTVEIEGIGEKGDGIARVERGYVIIVPDTEKRDRVTIEITKVSENVAFSEVVERKQYYE